MALTEQERNIAQQVKEQWGTRQQITEVLNQFRARQPKQQEEFKSLSQTARESLEKTPEELLWVDEFKDDVVEWGQETLWQKIQGRWKDLKDILTTKQTIFSPEFKENIKQKVWETEWWKITLNLLDQFSNILWKIPWSDIIKDKVESDINNRIKQKAMVWEAAWVVNDIIWAWFNQILEFTWLDKQLQKLWETETMQNIWEVLQEWSEAFNKFEQIAPWLATDFKTWNELLQVTWFWKLWKVWKDTAQTTLSKIPTPSIKNQEVAEKIVNNVLKFKPNQKKKFRKQNIWSWQTPAEYLFKKGIISESSSADDIVKGLEDLHKTSKQTVDTALQSVDELYKNPKVNQSLDALIKEFNEVPWLEDKVNTLVQLRSKATRGEWLTLSEINQVKRDIDDWLDLFWVTWDIKSWAKKQWLANIRKDIKDFIEQEAKQKWLPNIKDLNKDTQLTQELLNMVWDNLEAWASTRLFGLTDVIVWGAAWLWADLWTWAAIVLWKKLAESEAVQLAFAKRIAKISPVRREKIITKLKANTPLDKYEKLLITNAIIQAEKDVE